MKIELTPLQENDKRQFALDNQRAFQYGAVEEFGMRDDHFNEDGEIISAATIEKCIAEGDAFRILADGVSVGGVVVKAEGKRGELELLFVLPERHTEGIGAAAWQETERRYPAVKVWETCTPYFEKRNIHFYVNKCGFHAVEFFSAYHPDRNETDEGPSEMFRFEKRMP